MGGLGGRKGKKRRRGRNARVTKRTRGKAVAMCRPPTRPLKLPHYSDRSPHATVSRASFGNQENRSSHLLRPRRPWSGENWKAGREKRTGKIGDATCWAQPLGHGPLSATVPGRARTAYLPRARDERGTAMRGPALCGLGALESASCTLSFPSLCFLAGPRPPFCRPLVRPFWCRLSSFPPPPQSSRWIQGGAI